MKKRLRPDLKYGTIYEIDRESLMEKGISGLFFDIDNTMEPYNAPLPSEKLSGWLKECIDRGFTVGIVSNAKKERIARFVAGFPDDIRGKVLYVYGAAKPSKKGFRKLCGEAGIDAGEAAMIGDQLFTDIWGGNRSGLTTVLVTPIDLSIEPGFVRFKRLLERPFL